MAREKRDGEREGIWNFKKKKKNEGKEEPSCFNYLNITDGNFVGDLDMLPMPTNFFLFFNSF